jgi:hypothetical protein
VQDINNKKETAKKSVMLKDLPIEDKGKFVGFFALLIKVDKRINPALYHNKLSIR